MVQRKLNAAQKMLYNPKFSVKEIADSLGFRRDSYFCEFFKKAYRNDAAGIFPTGK
jgi:AraC-like DNA-binding protein